MRVLDRGTPYIRFRVQVLCICFEVTHVTVLTVIRNASYLVQFFLCTEEPDGASRFNFVPKTGILYDSLFMMIEVLLPKTGGQLLFAMIEQFEGTIKALRALLSCLCGNSLRAGPNSLLYEVVTLAVKSAASMKGMMKSMLW